MCACVCVTVPPRLDFLELIMEATEVGIHLTSTDFMPGVGFISEAKDAGERYRRTHTHKHTLHLLLSLQTQHPLVKSLSWPFYAFENVNILSQR